MSTQFGDFSTIKPSLQLQKMVEKNSGPYVGLVTNNRDPERLGRIAIIIEASVGTTKTYQSHEVICRYMTPFYGTKGAEHTEGSYANSDAPGSYSQSRHSYGMWMVPPDVGTRVMVLFVEGDASQAYWIGCIPEPNNNFMTPGIAASTNTQVDAQGDFQLSKEDLYGTDKVPAGEINTRLLADSPGNIKQPVHPFAETLRQEGLIQDAVRGTTTSSARRESPSQVYGISTPGRKDPRGKKRKIGGVDSIKQEIVDRLTGHTFVMDDGDSAGENQLVRMRSASGHQLLLNDSAGVVYLANGSGNVWMEFSANGAIDIYAGNSVNIRAGGDLNLHSDSDINMFARNQIKLRSLNKMVIDGGAIQQYSDTDIQLQATTGSITEKAPNGSILSYAGQQQIHMASGQHHLTGGQVHFNSIGTNSSLFNNLERTNATDTNPFGTGTRHVFVPDVNPMEKYQAGPLEVTVEGNVSMSGMRVPTHEPFPYHYDKIVSFVGMGPSLNDKIPGTAEFIAQRNRTSENPTIRIGQFQADLQAHLESIGLGTVDSATSKISKKSTSVGTIAKIQKAADDFTNRYNALYNVANNPMSPITAGVNDAIDQTISSIKGEVSKTLKDQIFVKDSGVLFTAGNLSQKVSNTASKVIESLSSPGSSTSTIAGIFQDNAGIPDTALSFVDTAAGAGKIDKIGLTQAGLGILRSNSSKFNKAYNAVNTGLQIGAKGVEVASAITGKSQLEIYSKGASFVQNTYKNIMGGKVTAVTNIKSMVSTLGTNIGKTFASVTSAVGGFFSKWSDKRLKEEITLVGKSPRGINIYQFKYKQQPGTYQGVMAQEVPWASVMTDTGYYKVDYSKTDVEFRRLN